MFQRPYHTLFSKGNPMHHPGTLRLHNNTLAEKKRSLAQECGLIILWPGPPGTLRLQVRFGN